MQAEFNSTLGAEFKKYMRGFLPKAELEAFQWLDDARTVDPETEEILIRQSEVAA